MKTAFVSLDGKQALVIDDETKAYTLFDRETGASVSSRVKGQRACSTCREAGHRATTCTKGRDVRIVGRDDGQFAILAVDMKTRVQELKALELPSIKVAEKLGLSLAEVNRYW